jgi:hypothetical protein
MRAFTGSRPRLRLVEGTAPVTAAWSWFCGHCAAAARQPPVPSARVCPSCGLGLLLETPADAAPQPRDAFLVVDDGLLVQAVSRRAQGVLAVSEEVAVNRPISELLVTADAEAQGNRLAMAIVDAAHGTGEPVTAFVRPWNTFGVRMRARIAPCGPPRAALLVLQSPRQRPLRAVD